MPGPAFVDWQGNASWASHAVIRVEVLNVGSWLTQGDYALAVDVEFLAVSEHRWIPAEVHNEWSRLRRTGIASVWEPASQEASHVGNAWWECGVGVVILRGAPLSLPAIATSRFRVFFDLVRAVRRLLPLGCSRFMHQVVLHGYEGADYCAEQLNLTDQLFDAALGELAVVARGQPCLMVGNFNVEPTPRYLLCGKGVSAGLWVDLQACWAAAAGVGAEVT